MRQTQPRVERNGRPAWLGAFVAGERGALESCYREYFRVVDQAVAGVLSSADRDAVVHDVFYKLMTRASVRMSFAGDNLGAWIRTVARNQAVDFARRRGREVADTERAFDCTDVAAPSPEGATEAKQLIELLQERLPENLLPVFMTRYVEQRSQREAASMLGVPRTTLVYHEERIRHYLRKLLKELDE